jgi:DNA-directed RNA polymerase subunit RPC12/RpoP
LEFENCPYCSQKILKGALKCPGCSRILQTPEEREALIQKYKISQKKSGFVKILKFVILLLAIGGFVYFFLDDILKIVNAVLNK